MGRFVNSQAENVLDALFSGVALDAPSTWDVGLSSTAIADDGTGATEPTVGVDAYDRVTTNANTTDWPLCDPDSRRKSNGVAVDFPEATGPWGDMSHFLLFEGGTDNLRAWGALDSVYTVEAGVQPGFDPDTLVVTSP